MGAFQAPLSARMVLLCLLFNLAYETRKKQHISFLSPCEATKTVPTEIVLFPDLWFLGIYWPLPGRDIPCLFMF